MNRNEYSNKIDSFSEISYYSTFFVLFMTNAVDCEPCYTSRGHNLRFLTRSFRAHLTFKTWQ